MYGVVLWSDKADQKAVIWCEDHGDLAFYSGCKESVFDGPSLDEGDFVEFELSESQSLRVAHTPQIVAQSEYHGLAKSLSPCATKVPAAIQTNAVETNVIPFAPKEALARLAC